METADHPKSQETSRFCALTGTPVGSVPLTWTRRPQRGRPPGFSALGDLRHGLWGATVEPRVWRGPGGTPRMEGGRGGKGTQPPFHPWNSGLCRIQSGTVLTTETTRQEGVTFSRDVTTRAPRPTSPGDTHSLGWVGHEAEAREETKVQTCQ